MFKKDLDKYLEWIYSDGVRHENISISPNIPPINEQCHSMDTVPLKMERNGAWSKASKNIICSVTKWSLVPTL